MKKAAIYLRVSTTDQEYERQEFELRNLAISLGFEVVKVYEEKKSAVADMGTREELTKLRTLTKNDVERIFIWDISRLSRKAANFIILVNEFTEKGICLHFYDKNIITLDKNGKLEAMASIYLYILGVFAQMEAENLRIKFKSGLEESLRKGHSYTVNPPFGYTIKDKHLVVLESEAKYVRLAFDLYSKGKKTQYITDIFNSQNVPLKRGNQNIIWTKGTVYKILKNTVYKGKGNFRERRKNEETGQMEIWRHRQFDAPVIISEEQFDFVQKQFELNRNKIGKGKTHNALLRGLIKCGMCGKFYVLAKNNKEPVYVDGDIRANTNTKANCNNGLIKMHLADTLVWEAIRDIYKYDAFKDECKKEKEKNQKLFDENEKIISGFRNQLSSFEKEKDRANTAFVRGSFDIDTLEVQLKRINSDISRIEEMITEKQAENSSLFAMINMEYDYSAYEGKELSFEEKKQICNDLIQEVLIFTYSRFERLLHIKLKVGIFFTIMLDNNTYRKQYYVFNDRDISFKYVSNREPISVIRSNTPDELKDLLQKAKSEQGYDPTKLEEIKQLMKDEKIKLNIRLETIKDFTIQKSNNLLKGCYGEYSYSELWNLLKEKNLLLPITDKFKGE